MAGRHHPSLHACDRQRGRDGDVRQHRPGRTDPGPSADTRSTPTSCPGSARSSTPFSGGNAYRAELYFVGTREFTGFKFGGRVDDVQDPRTGLVVTLRVFGDYAMHVVDPVRLVTNLTATVDVTDNERISGWVSDQVLKVLRTHVTTQIIRNGWPILGLIAYSAEIEQATIEAANGQLAAYGVQLTRMGNFDVNLSPEDEKQLKQLAKDTSYSQLAGGFQNYAQGEMALGAGQGMAQGGRRSRRGVPRRRIRLASAMRAQQVANQQAQPAGRPAGGRPAGGGPAGHAGLRSWWPAAVRRRALWPRCPAPAAAAASAAAASAAAGPASAPPSPGRCARPARRPTRRARGSAMGCGQQLAPAVQALLPSAAPDSRPVLPISAPAAAPGSAAEHSARRWRHGLPPAWMLPGPGRTGRSATLVRPSVRRAGTALIRSFGATGIR